MTRISYDCALNIPEIRLTFDGKTDTVIRNHAAADVDLPGGRHKVHAEYTLFADGDETLFISDTAAETVDGRGCRIRIDRVMKSFSIETV